MMIEQEKAAATLRQASKEMWRKDRLCERWRGGQKKREKWDKRRDDRVRE